MDWQGRGSIGQRITRRTREIGIRLALGASPRLVRRRVLVEGLRPALVGAILGMLLAYPATHLLIEMLFGVSERDPLVLGGSMAVLMLIAGLASYVPARSGIERGSGDRPSRGVTYTMPHQMRSSDAT